MNQEVAHTNILIVDDHPDNLLVLSSLLSQEGYRVRKATSGAFALKAIEAELPDLILLDIQMPQMDGYELCSRLKAGAATRDIPVLFLSALDDVNAKVRGFAVGGADYVTKPFQGLEVLARVKHHLTMQYQRKQLMRLEQELLQAKLSYEQLAAKFAQSQG